MNSYGIVLSIATYVRARWEPEGAVFSIGKTIDKDEADKLVFEEKARRVPIITDAKGGTVDDQA